MAKGFEPLARRVETLRRMTHATAVVTTDYAPTGWLAFYLPTHAPVVQVNEPYRWIAAPKASPALLRTNLLYVAEAGKENIRTIAGGFSGHRQLAHLVRATQDRTYTRYDVYLLSGWRGAPIGCVVNGP